MYAGLVIGKTEDEFTIQPAIAGFASLIVPLDKLTGCLDAEDKEQEPKDFLASLEVGKSKVALRAPGIAINLGE